MATQTTNLTQATDTRARLMARVDAFFATLGQGMNAYMHRKSRMDEIEALHAKSDAELAEIGITRDDIPRYVFRDTFYI
ncbi:MAG: hypothetical protein QUV10_03495 [Paracoccaceae bacterium]|jgi:uncharacterized protein YjiS (DUF1127 family)|uniref:hypothetical protein n=1 Tax=unclassified Seohaeicola TaxID=2641111 RepID=UPI00237A4425|nr:MULTISPECIES: hypothetical protein [unclassified Seohaeicola]MDD9706924.1 hypothetical protein [Seohaeicola sp. 4SK31]MDD9735160.1 hypothetical protein [Seohaeicola sp. SP36]MDF1709728.1 hypothetical protein [Paracoccaceae bacterium]MDM7968655.1 hypothetical protein [Paracoccaceae bacterium]